MEWLQQTALCLVQQLSIPVMMAMYWWAMEQEHVTAHGIGQELNQSVLVSIHNFLLLSIVQLFAKAPSLS